MVESMPVEQLKSEYLSLASAYSIREIELKGSEERCLSLYKEAKENKELVEELFEMLKTALGHIK